MGRKISPLLFDRPVGPPEPDWIGLYLMEDLGSGDITSDTLLPPDRTGRARIVARERLLVAGTVHAAEIFRRLGAKVTASVADGAWAEKGATVMQIVGSARAILAGERTALNLLARMSGIATATRGLAEALARAACSGTVVAGTRKTTPGFRRFEKEAIRIGGGDPHRRGLWDEAMVKDNHLAAFGKAGDAVRRVKAVNPGKVVTCEVESLADAEAAAAAGADWLLIDNQPPEVGKAWAAAVAKRHPEVRFEASGGITPDRVELYGWADRISLGWLTQKSPAKDLSLEWEEDP